MHCADGAKLVPHQLKRRVGDRGWRGTPRPPSGAETVSGALGTPLWNAGAENSSAWVAHGALGGLPLFSVARVLTKACGQTFCCVTVAGRLVTPATLTMTGGQMDVKGCSGGGWDGMGMCPAPVLTWPEAPGSETLWLTCQDVAGSPALDSGVTGHRCPSVE